MGRYPMNRLCPQLVKSQRNKLFHFSLERLCLWKPSRLKRVTNLSCCMIAGQKHHFIVHNNQNSYMLSHSFPLTQDKFLLYKFFSICICNVWVTESTLFCNYRFCEWHCHCSTPPMPSGRFPCYCRDDTYDTIILWCWLANKQLREHYSDCHWFDHILM